ncbi:MAG: tRNA 4-thiouridine(8) synthase ThiI [Clostridia bacterium]|nr:tRNA 4-thiouridine(8) synthase ThiI [Clostridia bacterium]
MREVILCKYGEIVLKGLNKSYFESTMVSAVKRRMAGLGNCDIHYGQSVLYIEPLDDDFAFEEALRRVKCVFGIVNVIRAASCEKNLESILATAKEYLPDYLRGAKSFKVTGKRADKRFPMTSPEISAQVGGAILSAMPRIEVDLYNPEKVVHVEIRENAAFLHADDSRGAGGIPSGTSGRALLLLSGGIDSPVAGYMVAKRGAVIEALHFESFPYTSERAKEKVLELARLVTEYTGKMNVHVISLTKIQEELKKSINEEYFTLLLRRSMMRLAERVAKKHHCEALVTGESLGQVASQTMQALGVTDSVVDMPVFRPCIGMDKEEIITIARKINTFETSILPYEDCCTVFTPKHPKTRPALEKVIAEEKKLDMAALEDEAFAAIEDIVIKTY